MLDGLLSEEALDSLDALLALLGLDTELALEGLLWLEGLLGDEVLLALDSELSEETEDALDALLGDDALEAELGLGAELALLAEEAELIDESLDAELGLASLDALLTFPDVLLDELAGGLLEPDPSSMAIARAMGVPGAFAPTLTRLALAGPKPALRTPTSCLISATTSPADIRWRTMVLPKASVHCCTSAGLSPSFVASSLAESPPLTASAATDR